jgi:Flp pilus assembly protein TadG
MRPVRRHRRERGASLVEFALIAPLFVLLTLGVVDIGRAFMLSNQMRGAAREAAVFVQNRPNAQVPGTSCADPDNGRWKALNERGATGAQVQFSPAVACGASGAGVPKAGDEIEVTVFRDMELITPFAAQLVGNGSTMRVTGRVTVVVQGV